MNDNSLSTCICRKHHVRLWTTRVRVCDGNAMNVRCVFLGAPENLGFLGRAEALVARRLIGVPRELRSNGERRSDGALYFGMPKSFSEIRDDEGYRLCDSSAECECKDTTNILGFANFFRKKVKKIYLTTLRKRMNCMNCRIAHNCRRV